MERGRDWPEEWKVRLIVPIRKKGRKDSRVQRSDTNAFLIQSVLYMAILVERVKEGMEEKKLISDNHTALKRKGTMDNIYVLNYVINRQNIGRKGGEMMVMFVDLNV